MKFTFKSDETLNEDELVIHHNSSPELLDELYHFLMNQKKTVASLVLYSRDEQFFVKPDDLLFFETEGNVVYAHSNHKVYESKYRLYELEESLPSHFMRISKSTICNINEIRSLSRTLTTSTSVTFKNSPKTVYVSRMYYKDLQLKLEKRINLWKTEKIEVR